MQDLRYAFRALRQSPGFATVAILSLALGIGANTAIFSLIDAVMLKPLPVSHPEELLEVNMADHDYFAYSNPLWEELRDRQDVFSGIFGYGRWAFNLSARGEVRTVNGYFVAGQFFDTLGVHAAIGRTLTPADDYRGCPGIAVLSYGFWQREYGGRADILGKAISIDNHPIEVVGVSDPRFSGVDVGSSVAVMTPLCAEKIIHGETSLLDSNTTPGWLRVLARPKTGTPASQATARLEVLSPRIYAATLPPNLRPEDQDRYLHRIFATESAANGFSYLRGQYHLALIVLMGIVAVVLLIACANVANLLLARGAARQREIAIRMALGCGRARLVRQLLTESLLLSGIGAALGILFARWGTSMLVRYLDVFLDLTPDLRLLAFTSGVAIVTGLLFGMAPAWGGSRVEPQAAMKANSRGVVPSSFGLGKVLVTVQVALSLLLVVGAALMVSTLWKLTSLDAGFDRDHVLLATIDIRNGHYPVERRGAVYAEILQKLRAIPGVASATVAKITPLCHCNLLNELAIDGYAAKSRQDTTVNSNWVGDRYFETLGMTVVAGRDFNSHDTLTAPKVALVNQTLARKYFGDTNPLGKHYQVRSVHGLGQPVEIIGIVTDAKYDSMRNPIPPTAYNAWAQDPAPQAHAHFELRAARGAPGGLITAAKSAIGEVNRDLAILFLPLATKVEATLERERLLAILSAIFGVLALMLATIGLYGVMSYNVTRRRSEMGIRMALGAEPAQVLKMVLREAAILIGVGLAAGLGAAAVTTRLVSSFLYGLQPNDPLTLTIAAALLGIVTLAAGYVPARRASHLDPMAALREE